MHLISGVLCLCMRVFSFGVCATLPSRQCDVIEKNNHIMLAEFSPQPRLSHILLITSTRTLDALATSAADISCATPQGATALFIACKKAHAGAIE